MVVTKNFLNKKILRNAKCLVKRPIAALTIDAAIKDPTATTASL